MIYQLMFTSEAQKQLQDWKRSGQKKVLQKIIRLLEELQHHPMTGTGQVEQLRGNLSGLWSRRIDKGNRLVYAIEDDKIIVTILSVKGHY